MSQDAILRISAQVAGVNSIKSLSDGLQGLRRAGELSNAELGRMQIAVNRAAREAGNTVAGIKAHAAALDRLRDRTQVGSNAYNRLGREADALRGRLTQLTTAQEKLPRASANSLAGMSQQISRMQQLRQEVDLGTKRFDLYSAGIARLQAQMARATAAPANGMDWRTIGGAAGGTLAVGGGVQGAVGALAGGLAFSGGPAGMIAGAGVAAIGGAAALAARVGVEAETAEVRLKALTMQFGEYNAAQTSAARIASTLRISQIEAADGLSKLYAALRPTGISLQEVEDAYIGFNAAARASGATATESSAALLQLKQALGSGVLQGDELRSLREQAPAVGQAIAAEMGVTIDELKKLGSQGAITTDIVIKALAKLKDQKLGLLQEQFKTSSQVMKDLSVATEDFGRTVARVFGPVTVNIVKGLTEAVKRLNDASIAFRDPTAATAAGVIRSGRMPGTMASQTVLMQGARELFKGSSGAGGVGMTGLRQEAEALAKLRRQPVDAVLFGLMRNRLDRVDSQAAPSADQQQARNEAAAGRAAGRSRLAAAARQATTVGSGASKTGAAAAKAGPDYPAYINQSVLRDWLRSQGFDRTSGDFTNRGHKTPNHMLNAMDMGVLTGPYDVAVQKTAAMRRRLAATGAFGNQLFGPGDPGHTDHLHIPTPGGRVKMTPGLAKLTGLGGAERMAGDIVEWRNQAADRADQEREARANQLASARELLATNQGLLRIAEATGPAAKALAEFEAERAEQARRYTELLKGVNGNPDAQAALNAAQAAEAGRAELAYREDLKRITAEQLDLDRQRLDKLAELNNEYREIATRDSASAGFKQGMQEYYDSIGNLRDGISDLTVTGFKGLEDAAMSLATTGSTSFKAFASSILADASRMILRTLVLKTIMEAIGAITKSSISVLSAQGDSSSWGDFTPPASADYAAHGATFANGIAKFARGGAFTNSVVNRATLFKFASGGSFRTGVLGEAGPEAIMPLLRDGQGRLGVSAKGGATGSTQVNIAVHVHPNGNVSSNSDGSGDARALGDNLARMLVPMVAPMVDRQLQLHMERGGLLNK